MIDVTRDIVSLTEFRRSSAEWSKQLKAAGAGGTLVLTVNGKADLVVVTTDEYKRLSTMAEQMEDLLAIRRGLDDVDAGRGIPFEEAFDRLFKKHGI